MSKIDKLRGIIREEVRNLLTEARDYLFWITPDGEFIEIHRTHMMYVADYPLKFFSEKELDKLKEKKEKLPFEAQWISYLKNKAVDEGAIRGSLFRRPRRRHPDNNVNIEGKRWAIEENINKILDVVPVGNVVFRVDVRKKGGDIESYEMNQENFVEEFS